MTFAFCIQVCVCMFLKVNYDYNDTLIKCQKINLKKC